MTRGSNMHRVWDSGILERTGRNEDAWLVEHAAIDTPEAIKAGILAMVEVARPQSEVE